MPIIKGFFFKIISIVVIISFCLTLTVQAGNDQFLVQDTDQTDLSSGKDVESQPLESDNTSNGMVTSVPFELSDFTNLSNIEKISSQFTDDIYAGDSDDDLKTVAYIALVVVIILVALVASETAKDARTD